MIKAILETPFEKGGPGSGRKKGPQVEYGKYKGRFPIRRKKSGEETEASKRSRTHKWLKLLPEEEGPPERTPKPEKPQLFGYHGARKSFSEAVFEKAGKKGMKWKRGTKAWRAEVDARFQASAQRAHDRDVADQAKLKELKDKMHQTWKQEDIDAYKKHKASIGPDLSDSETHYEKSLEKGGPGSGRHKTTLGDVVIGTAKRLRGYRTGKADARKFHSPELAERFSPKTKAEKDFDEIREWQRNKK